MPASDSSSNVVTNFLGLVLVGFGAALAYLLVKIWPLVEVFADKPDASAQTVALFGGPELILTPQLAYIALAALCGALGSFIHIATSFADYVGNETFRASWLWWYLLRSLIGAALAILVLFALLAGLINGTDTAKVDVWGIAALAGLSGLFSKQAADKLKEVFETLFSTSRGQGDDARNDKLTAVALKISSLEPATAGAGLVKLPLKILGQGFTADSIVEVAGQAVETRFVSPSELAVELAGPLPVGTVEVVVVQAGDQPSRSDPVGLVVGEAVG